MKGVAVVVVVLLVVAGLAVNGSRAQPLSSTSVAFRLCPPGQGAAHQCRPLLTLDQAALDGDYREAQDAYGGDAASDNHWWDLATRVAVAVAQSVAQWWASHYSGSISPDAPAADWTIFDPAE